MKKRYLFPSDYMADPSVHVFNGRVYIYPSHDWECENVENDNGDQYVMKDYHVLSTDDIMNGQVVDHGKVIGLEDIPWAGRQLWDCDVQEYEIEVPTNAEEQAKGLGYSKKKKRYIMYFPMKDRNDVFHWGTAIADRPEGAHSAMMQTVKFTYTLAVSGAASFSAIRTTSIWRLRIFPRARRIHSPAVAYALPRTV